MGSARKFLGGGGQTPTNYSAKSVQLRSRLEHASTGSDVTLEYVDATTRYVWTPFYSTYQLRWIVYEDATTGFWKVQGVSVYEGGALVQDLATIQSVYEYVYKIKPDAASAYEWTGSGHGNENVTGQTWKDQDGNTLTVSAGSPTTTAQQVFLTQAGTSRHTETGATDLADFECVTTFDCQGMQVSHQHDWLQDVYVGNPSYSAMFACDDAHTTKAHLAGDAGTTLDLTPDDGSYLGGSPSRCVALWSAAHDWVAWLYVTSEAGMGDWVGSDGVVVQDRGDGTINKIYMRRVSQRTQHVSNGDTWQTTTIYRVSFEDDPDNVIVPV